MSKNTTKIQLVDGFGNVLFQKEKSKDFPDYKTVLKKALELKIGLKDLYVYDQDLDGLVWQDIQLAGAFFTNCSIQQCTFQNCDLSQCRILSCTLQDTLFRKCILNEVDMTYAFPKKPWLKNLSFDLCELRETTFAFDTEIKNVKFWGSDLRSTFFNHEFLDFIEVINTNSRVTYCCGYDIVWYKYEEWGVDTHPIHSYTLQEFIYEVENEFPIAGIWPCVYDVHIQAELLRAIECFKLERAFQNRIQ